MMASCHTVVPERKEEGEINFQSTSPDEGALVRGAAKFSYIFNTRKPTEITIETVSFLFIKLIQIYFSQKDKRHSNY